MTAYRACCCTYDLCGNVVPLQQAVLRFCPFVRIHIRLPVYTSATDCCCDIETSAAVWRLSIFTRWHTSLRHPARNTPRPQGEPCIYNYARCPFFKISLHMGTFRLRQGSRLRQAVRTRLSRFGSDPSGAGAQTVFSAGVGNTGSRVSLHGAYFLFTRTYR